MVRGPGRCWSVAVAGGGDGCGGVSVAAGARVGRSARVGAAVTAPTSGPAVLSAAACREFVTGLLGRDAAYDGEPGGEPPLLVADYRRALYAVLALTRTRTPRRLRPGPGGWRRGS